MNLLNINFKKAMMNQYSIILSVYQTILRYISNKYNQKLIYKLKLNFSIIIIIIYQLKFN